MASKKNAAARRRHRLRRQDQRLAKSFNCPCCNQANSVDVSMDYETKTGVAKCLVCEEEFGTAINSLSAPIDVHAAWVDLCKARASGSTSASAGN